MPGWRVDLAPEHFLGEAEAEVHPDDGAPFPHGTSISFEATETAAAIRNAAENAARHYPLPVVYEEIPSSQPGGEQLDRRAFLDGAVHAEPWRGRRTLVIQTLDDGRSSQAARRPLLSP